MGDVKSDVHEDVERLAHYFQVKYGSLKQAKNKFFDDYHENYEMDFLQFEAMLQQWRVKVEDPEELFDHIDIDGSGRVSFEELFKTCGQTMQEVKRIEQIRNEAEVTRIYEELARQIHKQFQGSVENLFKDLGLENKEISRAGFKRLLTKLNMVVIDKMRDRVFNKMDNDGSDNVSLQELEKAVAKYLSRSHLVALAHQLAERSGSVATAFDEIDVNKASRRSSDSGVDLTAPSGEPMKQEEFERLLRRLRVTDKVKEGGYIFKTFSDTKPLLSLDDFRRRLIEVEEQEQKEEDMKRQKEKAHKVAMKEILAKGFQKRDAETALAKNDSVEEALEWLEARRGKAQKAQKDVESWVAKVANATNQNSVDMSEPFTWHWDLAARAGNSQVQLHEYKSGLETYLLERENELQALEHDRKARGWDSVDTPTDDASPRTAKTPKTPKTPFGVDPWSFDGTSKKQQKAAAKSDQFIQSAAIGDVTKLQQLLRRTNVNATGWSGVTALMAAARHGRESAVECLVLAGADCACTDAHGRTAVDHAQRGPVAQRSRIVNFLRSRGALSGKELMAQVDALAQKFFDVEKDLIEKRRINHHLQRTMTRRGFLHNRTDLTERTPASGAEDVPSPSFGLREFRQRGFTMESPRIEKPLIQGIARNSQPAQQIFSPQWGMT